MVNVDPTLETRLLEQVRFQYVKDYSSNANPILAKNCALLETFRAGILGKESEIDIVYILQGGLVGRENFVEKAICAETNVLYYNPHNSMKLVITGLPNKNHALLIVDNSWRKGDTFRQTLKYFENEGYTRNHIFVLHFFGSGEHIVYFAEKSGFVYDNPVLVSAKTMIDFFSNPSSYK